MKNTKGSQSHNKEQPQDIAANTLPGISFQLLVTWGALSLTQKSVIRKRQLNDSPHTSALYIFIRPEFTLSHILTELIPHKTLECSAKGPLFIWFVEKEKKEKENKWTFSNRFPVWSYSGGYIRFYMPGKKAGLRLTFKVK